uniref:Uncharacterized protein n=1 Tax=Lygus hesperus TaxID=30085 RepID=A0A0A9XV42_LYGHE
MTNDNDTTNTFMLNNASAVGKKTANHIHSVGSKTQGKQQQEEEEAGLVPSINVPRPYPSLAKNTSLTQSKRAYHKTKSHSSCSSSSYSSSSSSSVLLKAETPRVPSLSNTHHRNTLTRANGHGTNTTQSQSLGRSPSEAAARFRAAHTSLSLHHSDKSGAHRDMKNVTNNYSSPHK